MTKNILKHSLWIIMLALIFVQATFIDGGYQINLKINGYEGKSMIIAYHYGDKQFIKDTLKVSPNGDFVFKGEEALDGGMYIAFFPEIKKSFEFLVSEGEQNFTLTTNVSNFVATMKAQNSKDNEIFLFKKLNRIAKLILKIN